MTLFSADLFLGKEYPLKYVLKKSSKHCQGLLLTPNLPPDLFTLVQGKVKCASFTAVHLDTGSR